jgi:Na+/glutamate symporter
MTRIVLVFGLISGLIISGMFVLTIPFQDGISFERGAIIGYASMLAASLLIYFGIRSYRDNVGDGAVRFGRAFAVGILIVVVSNILYVATWEFVYPRYMPDFYQKYEAAAIRKAEAGGANPEKVAEIRKSIEMYKNPVMNVLITFMEPLPVGLLVTLISAWVLSRRRSALAPGRPLSS